MRAHPDLVALSLVLGLGLGLRLAFAFRAPVLVLGDSETYLGPALELQRGGALDLLSKRTPGYPVLIAATLALFGEDPRTLVLVQHLLGLCTVALVYVLGRQVAGRAAGLIAALATALAGNLLVYERLVMSEGLFASLLTASVVALVFATERAPWGWSLLAGLTLGGATLVRPVAQVLLLLVPLAFLLAGRGWRGALRGSLLAAVGFAALLGPWTIRNAAPSDAPFVGSLGQTLVGRTARHDRRDPATDRGFVFYDPAVDAEDPDPGRLAARKVLQEAANRGTSGRAAHTRLRKELGLSDSETDRLMRDLALEAILRRPGYYLEGTLQRFGRLWTTSAERLAPLWGDQGTIRSAWEDAPSAPLLEQLPGPIERELRNAEALAGFQPARLGVVYPALFTLGLLASLATRRYRLALVPALASLMLMGLSVALVGGVARYRYPEDPLIFVVAGVGIVWLAAQLRVRLSAEGGR